VTAHYIKVTGDYGILTETAPYLRAAPLEHAQESEYSQPTLSGEHGDLYEHCVKALRYGLKFGSHGLPLMGSGDWNDGMNLVGHEGKGESVWLGFFLISVMEGFMPLIMRRGDKALADFCERQIAELRKNLDNNAWDGHWYLRAFFDDGTPLGSAKNLECRIDSLPQSWSVFADTGQDNRREIAMESVYRHLVDREGGLIRLFTPPFDQHQPCPGYISGYLPGVRENGGQYTHAAIWVIQAFAKLGDIDRALELLELINPIGHGDTPEKIARYKVEPYVVAADVYGSEPHRGQGGWTWYSGSSAWLYRVILESILGFDLRGDELWLSPKLPTKWSGFGLRYLYKDTLYKIDVKRSKATGIIQRTALDGTAITGAIPLVDDRGEHTIEIDLL
jgi:cellobiose phosphorylase